MLPPFIQVQLVGFQTLCAGPVRKTPPVLILVLYANPFGAKGLEWTLPRLPDPHNFHEIPVVTEEAYAYGEDPHGDADATEEENKQEEHVV